MIKLKSKCSENTNYITNRIDIIYVSNMNNRYKFNAKIRVWSRSKM